MYEESDDGNDWDADGWAEEATYANKNKGSRNNQTNTNNDRPRDRQNERRHFEREAKERMNETNGNLMLIIAFSVVIIVDAIIRSQDEALDVNPGAAVGLSIVAILLSCMKYCHSVCVDEVKSPSFEVCFGFGLVVLWIVGAILLTFSDGGPFKEVATSGFFAVWVCLITSGHYVMSVWGSLSDEANRTKSWNFCGIMSFKKGVTPSLGITLVLAIGLLAGAISTKDGENGGRATFTIALLVPMILALLLMICLPLKWYGNPDNFLVLMSFLLGMNYLIVALTCLDAPFALREVIEGEEGPFDFTLVGVGFFTAIGLFVSLVVMMWNSHLMILQINQDNGTGHGFYGRHLWLALLFLSALIVLFASISECTNHDGCEKNDFITPALGLSLWTLVLCPVLFCLCRTNADNGDLIHDDPDWEIEYFANNYQRIEFLGALLLQLAWLVAAGALTFADKSPFTDSSAGYFFIWFGFFFSALYFQQICPSLGLLSLRCFSWDVPNGMKSKNNLGLALILFSVLVQGAATGVICVEEIENEGCSSTEFIAFGLQALLLVATLLLLFVTPDTLGICALLTSYLLMALSFAQLVVTTIVLGPFDEVQGNGFFAAWVSTYGAYYNLRHYEWKFVDI